MKEEIVEVKKIANSNREHLVFLTEEITAIKIQQKEMQKSIDNIEKILDKKERESEDYEKVNEKAHREIISIIEERFQNTKSTTCQDQSHTSKRQLCHS